MAVKAIAYSYWRRIKAGARTFDSVPDNVKEDIVILAKEDLGNGIITEEQYTEITGKEY